LGDVWLGSDSSGRYLLVGYGYGYGSGAFIGWISNGTFHRLLYSYYKGGTDRLVSSRQLKSRAAGNVV
jgi:hypothetical protein